ncbi:MAG: type II secretion system F family protein [Candidatus Paceibacterota bacterium]|jgi:type IV pilus assembly protein PilC
MPRYKYTAKTKDGNDESGEMNVKNERELALNLKDQGLILISAKEKSDKKPASISLPFVNRIPLTEKLMMTRNMQVMIAAGISLPRCIKTLSLQTKSKAFKKALNKIEEDILKGDSFSQAIKKHPKIFSNLFCSMIKVGEQTGGLDNALEVLSFHLERTHKLRAKIKGALMYPIIVVGAMLLIGAVMLVKVVPQLSSALATLNVELPKLTKIVMGLGDFFAHKWYVLAGAMIIISVFLTFLSKKEKGKRIIHIVLLKIPFVKNLIKKINTAYASRTLGSLIKGGVPIVEALEISADSLGNYFYSQSLKFAAQEVKKGKKISESIEKFPHLYPPLFVQMIQVGEETGKTSDILSRLSDFLEEEVTNITQNLSSVIEPVLLLLIGGVIAFFAVSMMQPIYSMMGSL